MNSSNAWNIIPTKVWRPVSLKKEYFHVGFYLFGCEKHFSSTIFEVTLFKVLFFSTNIAVFLTVISSRRMFFIWPKQNASCWLRLASGAFAVTFVLPKEKIFCFLFNLNIPPSTLFLGLPNWKVLYFQRFSFKTSELLLYLAEALMGSQGEYSRPGIFLIKLSKIHWPKCHLTANDSININNSL